MVRFRRTNKRTDEPDVAGDPFETSDVRIIPATPASGEVDGHGHDAAGDGTDSSVLAELSAAFDETGELHEPADVTADDYRDVDHAHEDDDGEVDGDTGDESRVTIAIGGGDEVDDIVYLDELSGDDDSGTVFIDDDGRSDAMQPSAAGAATVDSRLRQRRIGVRRAANRRRLYWIGGVVLALVLAIGGLAVLGSSWFAVNDVTVLGQVYADPDAVDDVVADLEGTPVLLVDTGDLERRLERIPWVETARVSTDFPDSATIELREREPVATALGADQRYRILDREGRVLDVIEGRAVAFVLITGPDTVDLLPGQFTDVGHAAAAALVTKLTPEVRARLISIETTADGSEMGLLLAADGSGPDITVRLGRAIGDNDQIEKLVRLERVLADADGAGVTQIDVSTAETTQR